MLREGESVHFRRIRSVALVAIVLGCASGGPRQYGQFNDFAPRVQAQQGERIPQHLTVQLARPANVAVFLVIPGRGSMLLFPADSTQTGYVEAGSRLVETSFRRQALSDSGRLVRRPADQPPITGRPTTPQQGRGGRARDTFPQFGFNQHGFLLMYASQEPLPYNILATRVAGISIPIEDNDALNTVTKLIRETTRTTGPWAAFATDFPP
jgi:hypothetical protein